MQKHVDVHQLRILFLHAGVLITFLLSRNHLAVVVLIQLR